jgi:hypothetical protein
MEFAWLRGTAPEHAENKSLRFHNLQCEGLWTARQPLFSDPSFDSPVSRARSDWLRYGLGRLLCLDCRRRAGDIMNNRELQHYARPPRVEKPLSPYLQAIE